MKIKLQTSGLVIETEDFFINADRFDPQKHPEWLDKLDGIIELLLDSDKQMSSFLRLINSMITSESEVARFKNWINVFGDSFITFARNKKLNSIFHQALYVLIAKDIDKIPPKSLFTNLGTMHEFFHINNSIQITYMAKDHSRVEHYRPQQFCYFANCQSAILRGWNFSGLKMSSFMLEGAKVIDANLDDADCSDIDIRLLDNPSNVNSARVKTLEKLLIKIKHVSSDAELDAIYHLNSGKRSILSLHQGVKLISNKIRTSIFSAQPQRTNSEIIFFNAIEEARQIMSQKKYTNDLSGQTKWILKEIDGMYQLDFGPPPEPKKIPRKKIADFGRFHGQHTNHEELKNLLNNGEDVKIFLHCISDWIKSDFSKFEDWMEAFASVVDEVYQLSQVSSSDLDMLHSLVTHDVNKLNVARLERAIEMHGSEFPDLMVSLENQLAYLNHKQSQGSGELKLKQARITNLSGADLQGFNFNGFDLYHFIFCATNLNKTTFSGAYIYKFTNCSLEGADFTGAAKVTRSVFRKNKLSHSKFENLDLTHAKFEGNEMVLVNFSGSNLSDARIESNNMVSVDISGSILSRTHLRYNKIDSMDFSDLDLSKSNFDCSSIIRCNFDRVKLPRDGQMNVENSSFRHISKVSFKYDDNSTFKKVDFTGSVFATKVIQNIFEDCCFKGVDLTGVYFLELHNPDLQDAILVNIVSTEKALLRAKNLGSALEKTMPKLKEMIDIASSEDELWKIYEKNKLILKFEVIDANGEETYELHEQRFHSKEIPSPNGIAIKKMIEQRCEELLKIERDKPKPKLKVMELALKWDHSGTVTISRDQTTEEHNQYYYSKGR